MKISKPVIVLGAGASKGARTGLSRTPPLDTDFLESASKIFARLRARGADHASVNAWRSFQSHLKRAGLRFKEVKTWRLEQLSTFLEARSNLKGLQLRVGRPKDYAEALRSLRVAVGYVLIKAGGTVPCKLHRLLFENVQPSAVISFNYDLIADQTLLSLARLNWRKAEYRGASTANVPTANGTSYYKHIHAGRMTEFVPLLKLHGSIHWERLQRGGGYRIAGTRLPESGRNTFEIVDVPDDPFLIPPVAAKIEIKDGALRKHWYNAVDQLHESKCWIIWGYSFPQTDTISQVLFRTALVNNRRAKRVIVVNPDAGVAKRVIDVCRKVKVEHYTSMESLLVELGVYSDPSDRN